MHQHVVAVHMQQLPMPQPVEQFVPVGRSEDFIQGIIPMQPGTSFGNHQEMQIMIAEHHHGCVFQSLDEAQG